MNLMIFKGGGDSPLGRGPSFRTKSAKKPPFLSSFEKLGNLEEKFEMINLEG